MNTAANTMEDLINPAGYGRVGALVRPAGRGR
jgi:hypothetical protein